MVDICSYLKSQLRAENAETQKYSGLSNDLSMLGDVGPATRMALEKLQRAQSQEVMALQELSKLICEGT